jgi:hypothetical protein
VFIEGSDRAVSFTDDTSLDSRKTEGLKVSIHASVLREKPLDWFYTLIFAFPDIVDELKSTQLVDAYFRMDRRLRAKINGSLKFVRINISDPRHYAGDLKRALSKILPKEDPGKFLRQLDVKEKELAETLKQHERRAIMERMLWDSPAQRLRIRIWATTRAYSLRRFTPIADTVAEFSDFDYAPFLDGRSRVQVDRVSVFTSKSGAVFFPAVDELEANPQQVLWSFGPVGLQRSLSQRYAFDTGDATALKWIDQRRHEILRETDAYYEFRTRNAVESLESLDSKKSLRVQAADIAAGVARVIMDREGLIGVPRVFEYVTHNGERISIDDAARIQRQLTGV